MESMTPEGMGGAITGGGGGVTGVTGTGVSTGRSGA